MSGGRAAKRSEGWEHRLDALIDGKRKVPFHWGTNNCMHLAAEAVQAMGIQSDVIAKWRGKHSTKKAIATLLKEHKEGLKGLAHEALSQFPQLHLHSAKRGDVVLVKVNEDHLMGICTGAEVAVLGENGMEFISLKHAVTVWGIGHK